MLPPVNTLCGRTLIVTLGVVPPPTANENPTLICPTLLVPLGEWTIVWNLVTIHKPRQAGEKEPPLQATFAGEKAICPNPEQELSLLWCWQVSPTQWAASIDNVTEKLADALAYNVAFHYGTNNKVYEASKICRHDPTIVVTKDPIEPDGYW